jgi:hypothetical protein
LCRYSLERNKKVSEQATLFHSSMLETCMFALTQYDVAVADMFSGLVLNNFMHIAQQSMRSHLAAAAAGGGGGGYPRAQRKLEHLGRVVCSVASRPLASPVRVNQ